MKRISQLYISLIIIATPFVACKKFLSIGPPKTTVTDATIFANKATIRSAINGIYSDMQSSSNFASGGPESISQVGGLSADEFTDYSVSAENAAVNKNAISPQNFYPSSSTWDRPYYYIYQCNALISGIETASALTDQDKLRLLAEVKFIRAFCYFYLTNLYGDVPLNLTTDYRINSTARRTPQKDIYIQIVKDLKDAQSGMAIPAVNDTRIIPNTDIATALLARVALYTHQYDAAISESNKIISNTDRYQLLADFGQIFLKESKEAIWQLQPVTPGLNTNEGAAFILTTAPINVALTTSLVNAFEDGDLRKANWISQITVNEVTYYFPYKYKVQSSSTLTEYSMVIRLAELYLIRAEAKVYQGDLVGAASDINSIRRRAGLKNTSATDRSSLLQAIEHEREVELFTEWGHRWMDLKRTDRATAVLAPYKPTWKSTAVLFPIPQAEINNNKNMTQNSGY